jgi:hypothetical protein
MAVLILLSQDFWSELLDSPSDRGEYIDMGELIISDMFNDIWSQLKFRYVILSVRSD